MGPILSALLGLLYASVPPTPNLVCGVAASSIGRGWSLCAFHLLSSLVFKAQNELSVPAPGKKKEGNLYVGFQLHASTCSFSLGSGADLNQMLPEGQANIPPTAE